MAAPLCQAISGAPLKSGAHVVVNSIVRQSLVSLFAGGWLAVACGSADRFSVVSELQGPSLGEGLEPLSQAPLTSGGTSASASGSAPGQLGGAEPLEDRSESEGSGGSDSVSPPEPDEGSPDPEEERADPEKEPVDEPLFQGERQGPTLSEVDQTMGGFSQDLPAPSPCPDIPETTCANFTGLYNGAPISGACHGEGSFADGVLSCQGPDFAFAIQLAEFTAAPPSKFAFIAGDLQTPWGFTAELEMGGEADLGSLETHQGDQFLLHDTHQQRLRSSGVMYQVVDAAESQDDEVVSYPFVSLVFAVDWIPRPTCPSCPEVRLRGALSSYLGPQ